MKVTHVIADDWQGIYFGNKLAIESHVIYAGQILEELVGKSSILDYEQEYIEDSTIWLDSLGSLPETLEEFYKLQEN